MWIVESILYAVGLSFAARQLALTADNMMHYVEIFGGVRARIAQWIAPEYYKDAIKSLPGDFDNWNIYVSAMYSEICKENFWFRLINCQYCMSFWFLIVLFPLTAGYFDLNLFICLPLSISFINVWFKLS